MQNSRYFDEKYYYFLRPDVFSKKRSAALHYLLYGWKEGTNPSEYFNTCTYLKTYPDINFNPLLHYELFGKNERRTAGIKPLLRGQLETLQTEVNNYRRQTAEIQLVVQEERVLRQNYANTIEELKKQINNITNILNSKLEDLQNDFDSKLADYQDDFDSKLTDLKNNFESMQAEQRGYFEAKLTKQQDDFESQAAKTQLEQEKTLLAYQKQELERAVVREENVLKMQRELFEVERKNFDLQKNIDENAKRVKELSGLEIKIDSYRKEHSQKVKAAEECLWADIFKDTVNDSVWLKNKTFSPGRWAVGYPYLYVLYRVLNEIKPSNILELGLGVSTKIIGQYAQYYKDVNHTVVENDSEWIDFFNRDFTLSDNTKIEQLNWVFEPFEDANSVRVFENFQPTFFDKQFDFISIDAPFGGDMKEYSRIDVCKMLPHCLKKSFVIMIDDYERIGEKHTVEKMKEKLNDAGLKYKTGVYSGKKDLLLFASEDLKFLCSM